MMQRHLDAELNSVKIDLLKMATMVEDAIHSSISALKKQDTELAKRVILNDAHIDEMEIEIEEAIIDIFALFQPMAVDLRFLATGMHVNTELERIADLTVNISQRAFELSENELGIPLEDIILLGDQAKTMVRNSIDAFVKKDKDLAKDVILSDKESNRIRSTVMNDLVKNYIMKDPQSATTAISLLLITRDLERICDHAAAIAEDVIYMVRAEMIRHHREKL